MTAVKPWKLTVNSAGENHKSETYQKDLSKIVQDETPARDDFLFVLSVRRYIVEREYEPYEKGLFKDPYGFYEDR